MSTIKVNTIDSHSGSVVTLDSTADLAIASTTGSTSSTTGALRVVGGISTQENLYVGGNAVITGTMTANGGTITLGNADTDNVSFGGEVNSDILPDATNTYDLGSASKVWAEVHATSLSGALTGNVTGNLTGNVTGNTSGSAGSCTGNSATATKLATARTIGLSGDVSGSASFDGSGNATITATVADDSHNHTVANVDGLQTALDAKAPLASPALTGAPTAPTAAANTNTTQIATTAYVQTELTDLIGGAPGTLDTLNELAAAINDDADYASTLTTALATKTAKTSNQSLSSAANAMTISGHTITLARGDGTTDTVTVPDNNTTYTVGNGGLTEINFTSADNTKLDGIATNANNYSHPTYAGDDINVDTGALTGATVVSDIDFNVTTDTSGHVTDANGAVSTRTLTLADLGYTGATNANYITNNNQLTNGAGYITSYVNTTYSAGTGLDLSGTTFSIEPDLRDGITHVGRDANDYLGIGTTNFNFYLDGGERARITNAGHLHADGQVIAYSGTISDQKLKTGITNVTGALDKVAQLNGVEFTYLKDGRRSAGVVAQDVEKVLPQAVTEQELPFEEGAETYKVVEYDALHALLIEAVKELREEIKTLKENK